MPPDLCGSYAPLFRLAKQGVLLLNASTVEPGYEGPLSCFLVNFSAKTIALRSDGPIAKIIFHRLEHQPRELKPEAVSSLEYKQILSECAKDFHSSFMDVSGIAAHAVESARKELRNWVVIGGVLIAVLLAWSSMEPLISKWLWEKHGIMTVTQRVEDAKMLKDLQAAQTELNLLMDKEKTDDSVKQRLREIEAQLVKLQQTRSSSAPK